MSQQPLSNQPKPTPSAASHRPQWHEAVIAGIDELSPEVKRFRFRFGAAAEGELPFTFRAGQWVALRAPDASGKPVTRAYSVASPPHQTQYLELCIKEVENGRLTPLLFRKKEGDGVRIRTPQGRFRIHDEQPGDLVFVATGTGVAPFASMIFDLLRKNRQRNMHLLLGVRQEHDILYRAELESLRQHAGVTVDVTLSRPGPHWSGFRGYVQEHLSRLFAPPADRHLNICGRRGMVEEVLREAQRLAWDSSRIFVERYD